MLLLSFSRWFRRLDDSCRRWSGCRPWLVCVGDLPSPIGRAWCQRRLSTLVPWSKLVKVGQSWSKSVKVGQSRVKVWSDSDRSRPDMVQHGVEKSVTDRHRDFHKRVNKYQEAAANVCSAVDTFCFPSITST